MTQHDLPPPPTDADLPPELDDTAPDSDQEPMSDDEVRGIWPGAYRDDQGAWVMPERGAPEPTRAHQPPDGGADQPPPPTPTQRLRERLYVGLAITSLPPLEPLVDGLLFLPGESVLYGPPGSTKTFTALDLALSVATGKEWMGRDVAPGPVLYIAAEGVGGLGARVAAWCEYNNVHELEQAAFLATAVNLLDTHSTQALGDVLDERRPLLTVIDTLARCSPGAEENSARDMGRVVESLDTIRNRTGGGHVCVVHHAGKDVEKGMRGSSALLGAVDTVLELSGDRNAIRMNVAKQKDAEPPDAWWASVQQQGASAVIVPRGPSLPVSTLVLEQVIGALEELPPQDRTASKWQAMADDAGVPRRTFFRAKSELLEREWVTGGEGRGAVYEVAPDPADSEPS